MKRGALVTFDFYPPLGGQGRHTYDLWRRLKDDADLDLMVLSPSRNDLPGHQRVFSVTRRLGRHLGFSLAASALIERWRRRYDLDFVHLNGGPGGLFLLRRPNTSVIYTVHHTYLQQARLVPGQGWKAALVPLERLSYRAADVVTGDCASTTGVLRSELGVPAAFTVPSGVDTQRFRPVPCQRVANSLLYVGRLDARKGITHLIRAMPHIAREAPNARLFVIGRGPLEERLRALAAETGVDSHVTFLGRMSDDELVRWYSRVDLTVVPSAFEGFGLTAVEAQACGTPVLATDTDGLRDLIEDGLTGRLVPFADPTRLADVAVELLRDREQRHALASRGQRNAQAYDWGRVVRRWREVYRWVPEAPVMEAIEVPA
jgi:glycosyltransferase involved in cell wall biosynthesis